MSGKNPTTSAMSVLEVRVTSDITTTDVFPTSEVLMTISTSGTQVTEEGAPYKEYDKESNADTYDELNTEPEFVFLMD